MLVKIASHLDKNYVPIRNFALPADGKDLVAAFPTQFSFDVTLFHVHTQQPNDLVPDPNEERSALAGECFPLSCPLTPAQNGAFFLIKVAGTCAN